MKISTTVFLALTVFFSLGGSAQSPQRSRPEYIYGLNASVDLNLQNLDFSDLQAIAPLATNADFIGIGESIHTTGGFYDMKVKLIKKLVLENGYRVVGMETPRLTATEATRFIAQCASQNPSTGPTLDQAVTSIFRVFRNTASREMFQFLCGYNRTHHDDPVQFFGFDMQEPDLLVQDYFSFLQQAMVASAKDQAQTLHACQNVDEPKDFSHSVPSHEQEVCDNQIEAQISFLRTQHDTLVAPHTDLSEADFKLAILNLQNLKANELALTHLPTGGSDTGYDQARDQAMAQTLKTLKELFFPQKKAVLWAHNAHLRKAGDLDQAVGQSFKNFGEWLTSFYPDRYRVVGQVAYQADEQWPNYYPQRAKCEINPIADQTNAVENRLLAFGEDLLYVDLRALAQDPNAIFKPDTLYHDGFQFFEPILSEYDALIFFKHSEPMVGTIWNSCQPQPDWQPPAKLPGTTVLDLDTCVEGDLPLFWTSTWQLATSPTDHSGNFDPQNLGCHRDPQSQIWQLILASDRQDNSQHVENCITLQNFTGRVTVSADLDLDSVSTKGATVGLTAYDDCFNPIGQTDAKKGVHIGSGLQHSEKTLLVTSQTAMVCAAVDLYGSGRVSFQKLLVTTDSPQLDHTAPQFGR